MSGDQTARPDEWDTHAIALVHVADGTPHVPGAAAVIPLQLGPSGYADHGDTTGASPAAPPTHHEQELDLLDWTISNLFYVGLTLLPAAGDHGEAAQRTTEALQHLDDTISRIRDHVLNAHAGGRRPQPE
jgi:hypothetical protein